MKNILVVESSPMGERSNSRRLTRRLIEALQEEYPGSAIRVRDLVADPPPHLSAAHVADPGLSDALIKELVEADILVIGAPMWNFGPPSALKAWIDHVVRPGRTFSYGANGPEGFAGGRPAYIVATAGGTYAEGGPFHGDYLRSVLRFIGFDARVISADGFAVPALKDSALDRAERQIGDLRF